MKGLVEGACRGTYKSCGKLVYWSKNDGNNSVCNLVTLETTPVTLLDLSIVDRSSISCARLSYNNEPEVL